MTSMPILLMPTQQKTSTLTRSTPRPTPEGYESEDEEYDNPSGESNSEHDEPSATYENSLGAPEEAGAP